MAKARARAKQEEYEQQTVVMQEDLASTRRVAAVTARELHQQDILGEWGEDIDILRENLNTMRTSIAALDLGKFTLFSSHLNDVCLV